MNLHHERLPLRSPRLCEIPSSFPLAIPQGSLSRMRGTLSCFAPQATKGSALVVHFLRSQFTFRRRERQENHTQF